MDKNTLKELRTAYFDLYDLANTRKDTLTRRDAAVAIHLLEVMAKDLDTGTELALQINRVYRQVATQRSLIKEYDQLSLI